MDEFVNGIKIGLAAGFSVSALALSVVILKGHTEAIVNFGQFSFLLLIFTSLAWAK